MILFLDFPLGERPPQELMPEGTIFTDKKSPDLDALIKINLNGKHVAHTNPRQWMRVWRKWPAKMEILRMAMGRFGSWRLYPGKMPKWDLDPNPKAMTWESYIFHRSHLARDTSKFNCDLLAMGSDYIGPPNPGHLFVGTENIIRNTPPLAYATTRRWTGWMYECLKAAKFDMSTVGMINARRKNRTALTEEDELGLIKPEIIVTMSYKAFDLIYWKGAINEMPEPWTWWKMHGHLFNQEFITVLKKIRNSNGRQPKYVLPPGTKF